MNVQGNESVSLATLLILWEGGATVEVVDFSPGDNVLIYSIAFAILREMRDDPLPSAEFKAHPDEAKNLFGEYQARITLSERVYAVAECVAFADLSAAWNAAMMFTEHGYKGAMDLARRANFTTVKVQKELVQ